MATTVSAPGYLELHHPFAGIDLSTAYCHQQARKMPTGDYARTSPSALNVRGYDPSGQRLRGGSRWCLARYIDAKVSGATYIVQELNTVPIVTAGGGMQQSLSGRRVFTVAISQGNVYYAEPGATSWSTATNNTSSTPPLNISGIMQSAAFNQRLYFADGSHWCYFVPTSGTVETWTATAGTLPTDSSGNLPRLIMSWQGRVGLSGLIEDPQNIHLSAIGNPHDFDYFPTEPNAAQAVAFAASSLGIIGDPVSGMCPYNDDVAIIFTDHQIHLLSGNPAQGGRRDLVSSDIGGVWGTPWCKDPYGNVYFVSNRMGVYAMVPGQQPQRISQQIESYIQSVNTGTNVIRLQWEDRSQGLHIFITDARTPLATTHLFWEQRTNAWWKDQFGNNNHNPVCCCTFDGNEPGDRVALIGSWDGYVRYLSTSATTDDGTSVSSYVVIGPLATANFDEMTLYEIVADLAEDSGDVTFSVYVGNTAEDALSSTAVRTGTLTAGRNNAKPIRMSGHAVYIKLSSSSPWAMERIRARVASRGKVRSRAG